MQTSRRHVNKSCRRNGAARGVRRLPDGFYIGRYASMRHRGTMGVPGIFDAPGWLLMPGRQQLLLEIANCALARELSAHHCFPAKSECLARRDGLRRIGAVCNSKPRKKPGGAKLALPAEWPGCVEFVSPSRTTGVLPVALSASFPLSRSPGGQWLRRTREVPLSGSAAGQRSYRWRQPANCYRSL